MPTLTGNASINKVAFTNIFETYSETDSSNSVYSSIMWRENTRNIGNIQRVWIPLGKSTAILQNVTVIMKLYDKNTAVNLCRYYVAIIINMLTNVESSFLFVNIIVYILRGIWVTWGFSSPLQYHSDIKQRVCYWFAGTHANLCKILRWRIWSVICRMHSIYTHIYIRYFIM